MSERRVFWNVIWRSTSGLLYVIIENTLQQQKLDYPCFCKHNNSIIRPFTEENRIDCEETETRSFVSITI